MRNYNSEGCNYFSQISACQMTLSGRLRVITALGFSSLRRVRRGQLLWRNGPFSPCSPHDDVSQESERPQMFWTLNAETHCCSRDMLFNHRLLNTGICRYFTHFLKVRIVTIHRCKNFFSIWHMELVILLFQWHFPKYSFVFVRKVAEGGHG